MQKPTKDGLSSNRDKRGSPGALFEALKPGMGGRVFVTVGTTRFDELIRAVDSHEVSNILRSRGHDALVVQKGSGEYKMHNLLAKDEAATTLANGLKVE
eukprot:evm.model.scf_945.4 EVM.evm.TU.scf_945.4   scf_945:43440-43840(+)